MTIEALWRPLSGREDDVDVPQWHENILDAREEMKKIGEARFIPWEEAKRQIDKACK